MGIEIKDLSSAKGQVKVVLDLLRELPDWVEERDPTSQVNIRSCVERLRGVHDFLNTILRD